MEETPQAQSEQNNEEAKKSRQIYEETLAREKKYANDLAMTFAGWHLIEGTKKAKTGLSPEEIARADAERINELKDKEKAEKLSEGEKEELEMRENSELFLDIFEERDTQARFPVPKSIMDIGVAGPIFKEAFYPNYIIRGAVKGREIYLCRSVYPEFTRQELEKESRNRGPFYMSNWNGRIKEEYKGEIDDKAISPKAAEKLFRKYIQFAKMRSRELREMKEEKEIKKYGRKFERNYDWRAVDNPEGDI